jgi:hypothetical protein
MGVKQTEKILVAGIPRSGTTWLLGALASIPGARQWHEPDNIDSERWYGPQNSFEGDFNDLPIGKSGFVPFPSISPRSDGGIYASLWDVVYGSMVPLNRAGRIPDGVIKILNPLLKLPHNVLHPMIKIGSRLLTSVMPKPSLVVAKTVQGSFYIDWIVQRYSPKVVMIERNPLNVISSWRELNVRSFDLMTREELSSLSSKWYDGKPPLTTDSQVSKIAWTVGLLTSGLAESFERNPEWALVRHEDLVADPQARYQDLFRRFDLPWSHDIDDFLERSNKPGKGFQALRLASEEGQKWNSKLSPSEVSEIRGVLAGFRNQGWISKLE